MDYDTLKEIALHNVEHLFDYWDLNWVKISPTEYDFINPLRKDTHHGSTRFNIEKGLGADFSGVKITNADIARLGAGFDRSDFDGIGSERTSWGFDIISLCKRLHGAETYMDAARLLQKHLQEVDRNVHLVRPASDAHLIRKKKMAEDFERNVRVAESMWTRCKSYVGTAGETYLKSRCIFLAHEQPTIRFHPAIMNKELQRACAALLFRVSKHPGTEMKAIHRVFLSPDGKGKADVKEPKMALGSIKGCAIWFGEPDDTLCIAEGPENALTVLSLQTYKFVCSTINSTNMANLSIPKGVKNVYLFPDKDKAGKSAVENCRKAYDKYDIKVFWPKSKDWNDDIIEACTNVGI